jgi:hypothetical protein
MGRKDQKINKTRTRKFQNFYSKMKLTKKLILSVKQFEKE